MSNEEKTNTAQEIATKLLSKLVAALLRLKQSNPKVFFGGAGAIAIIILFMMMNGDADTDTASEPKIKELLPGQIYTLKNPNSYGDNSATELVAIPGTTAAYDSSEENDAIVCKAANGTRVKIKNFADAFGKRNLFAQVEVQSGECAGKIGWTMVINIEE
jgi:hypothetical protein